MVGGGRGASRGATGQTKGILFRQGAGDHASPSSSSLPGPISLPASPSQHFETNAPEQVNIHTAEKRRRALRPGVPTRAKRKAREETTHVGRPAELLRAARGPFAWDLPPAGGLDPACSRVDSRSKLKLSQGHECTRRGSSTHGGVRTIEPRSQSPFSPSDEFWQTLDLGPVLQSRQRYGPRKVTGEMFGVAEVLGQGMLSLKSEDLGGRRPGRQVDCRSDVEPSSVERFEDGARAMPMQRRV